MNNTAVARGRFVDGAAPKVENVQVIFHQAPSLDSTLHFGGRLVFGRDGTLFITLGDRSITEGRMQAQRMDGLLGKIVRLNPDGSVPKDNPFVGKDGVRPGDLVVRPPQHAGGDAAPDDRRAVGGRARHARRRRAERRRARARTTAGRRSPTASSTRARPITGGIQQKEGMEQPRYYWDPVIAPSGMVFYTGKLFPAWQNSLFIGGLGSTNLVRLTLKGEQVVGEERLLQDLQPQRERIRDVRQGPDGAHLSADRQRQGPHPQAGAEELNAMKRCARQIILACAVLLPACQSSNAPESPPPASPATAVAAPHPLDALTADEIRAVAAIARGDARLAEAAFASVTLHEPAKADVLAWQPGGSLPGRRACRR